MKSVKDYLLILLSVLLLTLATPGYDFGFLALIAYVPLIFVIKRKKIKGWLAGYIFGFVYYLINLKWVAGAVNFYGNVPAIAGYAVLIFFAFYLATYLAVFGYICEKKNDIFLVSFVFVVLEAVKSYAFTGFPWINLGLSQYSQKYSIAWASVTGEFGLSFFVIIINFLVYYSIKKEKKEWVFLVLSLILFYGGGFGLSKMTDKANSKKINIDIVQTDYNQRDKWKTNKKNEIIVKVLKLLEKSIQDDSEMTVLPEAAFPVFIENEKNLFEYLKDLSKIKPILLGSLRVSRDNESKKFYNSVYFIQDGKYYTYDKRHLVPFGEYFPLGSLLKPVSYYFFGSADDFLPGESHPVFNTKYDFTISPLICYESGYTDLIPSENGKIADVIAVLTNDSWFGLSRGKNQHLALSIIRAVEYGKPVIRASQSGISACIDSKGQIISKKEDGEGILNCNIMINKDNSTFYSKYQYFWILIIISIIFYIRIKKRKE